MQDKQFSDVLSKAEVVWAHADVLRQLFPQTERFKTNAGTKEQDVE